MKNRLSFRVVLLVLVFDGAVQVSGQQLTVQTELGKHVALSRADLEGLPHVEVTTHDHDGSATLEGVALKAVLEKAGISFGETMRGKRLASCLLVEAADGYRAVIALPELDPAFTEKHVILAFLRDGKPLSGKEGP